MIDSTRRVLAVSAVLTVVFVASALAAGGFGWADLGLLALNTVPLLALHRNPLLAVLVFGAAYPLWLNAGNDPHLFQSLPTLVALYAVGSWPRPLWLRAVGLVTPAWMVAAVVTDQWADADLTEIGYIAVVFALAWALGVVVAARRSYAQQLEAKTAALEEARRELADRAVADERARIARELHDVIAHAMSVITVRAGVGAHLIDSRPAEAARALAVIERTGREALSEMRRMLSVLQPAPRTASPRPTAGFPDPEPPASQSDPQPGLANLPRLVEQVGSAGVAVTVATEGTGQPLPAGLDLAVYRVIQEALTNVVKHAPGARAAVTVRRRPDALEIEVRNPGRVASERSGEASDAAGGAGAPVTPGQGLRGMAERVALYDGRFEAGPGGDGFRVRAWFPMVEADS